MRTRRCNFNPIARPYRWLEYLTLGRALEHCRLYFLPDLAARTHALVIGDGDGRFLARLLQQNTSLRADAVDSSASMVSLLAARCHRASLSGTARLNTHHTDALTFLATPSTALYDLVVTHFFLDCLTEPELAQLIAGSTTRLTPGALWLVSDFRIPDGFMRLPAILLIRSLYFAFRILTGLRVDRLPDHSTALMSASFTLSARHLSLFGILTTELWSFSDPTFPAPLSSPTASSTSFIM